MKRRITVASTLIALSITGSLLGGCSQYKSPVVVSEQGSKENTDTLTPLERGKARREALNEMRSFTDAWLASDKAGMSKMLSKTYMDKFEKTWDGYAERGLKIKHVHEVKEYDVTQFNKPGTQATVTYTYVDKSYLVNASGKKVKSLPSIEEDASFTIERPNDKSNDWKIKRLFMKVESFR